MKRRKSHILTRRRKPLVKDKKIKRKSGVVVQLILDAEEALPGSTGPEKKAWVIDKLDRLFNLPPIAEEISDFIINLSVEIAYAGVQKLKTSPQWKVLPSIEYEALVAELSNCKKTAEELRQVNIKLGAKIFNAKYGDKNAT